MADKILRVVTVLFKREANQKPVFLLLHRCLNWKGWELLKGQLEPNETLEGAVSREVFEETGFKQIRIVKKIGQTMHFFDKVRKKESEVFGFLVEILEKKPVTFQFNPVKEHDSFEWVDEKTVVEKLRFENMREFFVQAVKELDSAKTEGV